MEIHKWITRTGVTVVIPTPDKDIEGFTLTVLDNSGKEVEVVASDVVKGQKEVYLKFKTSLTTDPTGVWTVGGAKFDLDLLKKIQDVVTYSSTYNEVKLYDALLAAGIQGVNVDALSDYATEIVTSSADTITEIQAAVTKVNNSNVTVADKVAILGNLFDAQSSSVKVRSVLVGSPFERVNPDWVAVTGSSNDYTEVIQSAFSSASVSAKSGITTGNAAAIFTAIQTGINSVNATNIDTYKGTVTDLTKATTYKGLIQTYVKNDATGETAKATKLAYADKTIALAQLKVTTSPVEAYRLLVSLLNVDTTDSNTTALLNEYNKQDYFVALNTYQSSIVINSVSSDSPVLDIVTNVITAGDSAALSTVVTAIASTTDNTAAVGAPDNGTDLTTVKANLQKLANVTSHKTGSAKFDMTIVDDSKLADYRTALVPATPSSTVANITSLISAVNTQASLGVNLDTISKSNDVTAVTTALTNLANAYKSDTDVDVAAHAKAFLNANSTIKAEVAGILVAQRNDKVTNYVPSAANHVFSKVELFGKAAVTTPATPAVDGALKLATDLHSTKVALFQDLGDLGASSAPTTTDVVDAIDAFVNATNDAQLYPKLLT
ncbi:hypothetical protein M1K46_02300 [Fictibacillus sp. WQ 8-8]|uniref:hypothetical protein n=1 Tax=Fictibacillus sp. WQ 8-8 TaxID=2938788 RepID=UPI00210BF029|nr:hypothetical protein [Fictibacillus sp. WQ 8-8]MCQ6264497.1 hypothetical protein [Fictibacillus sp. WQ 8-8]